MNEWGFAGEIKHWWDAEFDQHPEWGLSRCELERQPEGGGLERSDLTVLRGSSPGPCWGAAAA